MTHKTEKVHDEPETSEPLKVGDHVAHCAPGSPEMEITEVNPSGHASCRWWDSRGLQHGSFPLSALRRVIAKRDGYGPAVMK